MGPLVPGPGLKNGDNLVLGPSLSECSERPERPKGAGEVQGRRRSGSSVVFCHEDGCSNQRSFHGPCEPAGEKQCGR
jgi:hypothetical protein